MGAAARSSAGSWGACADARVRPRVLLVGRASFAFRVKQVVQGMALFCPCSPLYTPIAGICRP